MKLAKAVALIFALCLLATGCFRQGYGRNVAPETFPRYSAWHHHFFWGFIGTAPDIDLDGVCPESGVARVQSFYGPVGVLIGLVTAGIWVPATVQVWCAAGGEPVVIDLSEHKR